MAIRGGPDIIEDGLVLHLDAADRNSYPGSGSTWYDLSGNGNNGSFVGSATTHSFGINNGVMIFNQTTGSYIDVTLNLSGSSHTIMGASRYVSVGPAIHNGGRIISAKSNNWLLGHWDRSPQKYYSGGWVSNTNGAEFNGDLSWGIYTGLGSPSTDQYSFYVNDTLKVSNSNGGGFGPNGFSLGRYAPGNGEYSNSQVGFLIAYNRVLTDAEVKQNYNALKGRYGL